MPPKKSPSGGSNKRKRQVGITHHLGRAPTGPRIPVRPQDQVSRRRSRRDCNSHRAAAVLRTAEDYISDMDKVLSDCVKCHSDVEGVVRIRVLLDAFTSLPAGPRFKRIKALYLMKLAVLIENKGYWMPKFGKPPGHGDNPKHCMVMENIDVSLQSN